MSAQKTHVLIAGAGVFGASTALHLLRDPEQKYSVTVIDRALVLPAPDAASTDLNKIVRSSYADPWYTSFARKSIQAWKSESIYHGIYHESGVLMSTHVPAGVSYSDASYQNDVAIGCRVENLENQSSFHKYFPGVPSLGPNMVSGYINLDNGWAYASGGVAATLAEVKRLGGVVKPGCDVASVVFEGFGRATGVRLASGEILDADTIVIATGSWTPSRFSALVDQKLQATGQCIATIQLSPELAQRYSKTPVVLDFGTGFYMFPPNEDGIMKIAIHHVGYINPKLADKLGVQNLVSTPRTVTSHGAAGNAIPKEMLVKLRQGLRDIYPELGDLPIAGTRLCWYCDTPNTDWLIDFHPVHSNLLFATGGSGHGYKFLPMLGSLVKDRLEAKLDGPTSARFAFARSVVESKDPSRLATDRPLLLKEEDLVLGE
ncbi:FAD dependent oxidoreductase [Clavulina sp. PMI_390]|nr:FAD dependent oxidoreductase [Clavulina sp. PMI_390]